MFHKLGMIGPFLGPANNNSRQKCVARTDVFASKLAPTGGVRFYVGVSLLAMNDDAVLGRIKCVDQPDPAPGSLPVRRA
jgi:hypothetical protein